MKKIFLSFGFLLSLILTLTCCVKVTQPTTPQAADAEDLYQATVAIVDDEAFGALVAYCTGVWISPRHIITARHCMSRKNSSEDLSPGDLLKISSYDDFNNDFPEGGPTRISFAVLLAEDLDADLALLAAVEGLHHNYVSISSNRITLGEEVSIVGHPAGYSFSYIKGVVSQSRHMNMNPIITNNAKMLQITSLIWQGDSGGGAFNAQGELIGIATFMRNDIPGMAFFVHRDEIVQFLKKAGYRDKLSTHSW